MPGGDASHGCETLGPGSGDTGPATRRGGLMADGEISVTGLTKHYRQVKAVDDLSFTVAPGRVTGFLGPNAAGKTTTLRMILGLVHPTAGEATIGGVRYDEVIELVGLTPAAKRKFRGYSLGMRQRLGIAAAMLGDPQVLILDEPANGLDPVGIRWMRELLRGLAEAGRTILVSSHLLSEVQLLADDVLIISKGKLVTQGPVDGIIDSLSQQRVRVRTPAAEQLTAALNGATVQQGAPDLLYVTGADAPDIGRAAFAAGVELHELVAERHDLEQVFLELTGSREEIR